MSEEKEESQKKPSGKKIERRDFLQSLATVPALGVFGYALSKQIGYDTAQKEAAMGSRPEPPKDFWFIMGEYLPPPLGILQLAAYLELRNPDMKVRVVDCQAQPDCADSKELRLLVSRRHR